MAMWRHLPGHILAINDHFLIRIRAKSDGLCPSAAFRDLDVGAGLVCASAKEDDIASDSGIDSGLNGAIRGGRGS